MTCRTTGRRRFSSFVRAFFLLVVAGSGISAPALCDDTEITGREGPHVLSGRVLVAAGSPGFEKSTWSIEGLARQDSCQLVQVADINNDGRADLFGCMTKAGDLPVYFSEGSGMAKAVMISGLDPNCNWTGALASDLDFDGTKEFVAASKDRRSLCVAHFEHEHFSSFLLKSDAAPEIQLGYPLLITARDAGANQSPTLQLTSQGGAPGEFYRWSLVPEDGKVLHFDKSFTAPANLIGSGDMNGDLQTDFIGMTDWTGRQVVSCSNPEMWEFCRPLFFFWWTPSVDRILIGDFNGDGRSDVFMSGGGTTGTWLGLSGAFTAIEYELDSMGLSKLPFMVGDIDGDGSDDLVRENPGRSQIEIWRLSSGKPVSGAEVTLDAKTSATSNSAGEFRFDGVSAGIHTLQARYPAGALLERRVRVSARGNTIANLVNDTLGPRVSTNGEALGLNGLLEGPAVCIGYLPDKGNELTQSYSKWQMIQNGDCPDGYAFFGAERARDTPTQFSSFFVSHRSGAPIRGSCCKLAASDILTSEHLVEADKCPEGTVATGVHQPQCEDCGFTLRCTKINDKRYQLGRATPGVFWGVDVDMLGQDPRIPRSNIPAAIRDGIGRKSFSKWSFNGCIGMPWGSLLTSKAFDRCANMHFREVHYRGLPGDPQQGTPVKMFPDCKVRDAFDPLTGCEP